MLEGTDGIMKSYPGGITDNIGIKEERADELRSALAELLDGLNLSGEDDILKPHAQSLQWILSEPGFSIAERVYLGWFTAVLLRED